MVILVTGGSSGLGATIVSLLAGNADNLVYFTFARSAAAAAALESEYKNVRAIACNFTDDTAVDALLAAIPGYGLDVLINNANTAIHKNHFNKIPYTVFQESFALNIIPALRITQEAIKAFRKKKFGKIINIISSVVVNKPPVGWSEYAANKAYLLAMSKAWATENIRFNITSNSISPAFMLTALTGDTDERVIEQMTESHPLGRLLSTQEVADAVLYLINTSQQVNGINIVINAGSDIV